MKHETLNKEEKKTFANEIEKGISKEAINNEEINHIFFGGKAATARGKSLKMFENIDEALESIEKQKSKGAYSMVSSGSYGCAMYPFMRCDGQPSKRNSPNQLSKLVPHDDFALNEYNVGRLLLKKREEYRGKGKRDTILEFMNLVERKCEIRRSKVELDTEEYECNILTSEKYNKVNNYLLFQMEYIKSVDFGKKLYTEFDIKVLLRYFYFSLLCIGELLKHRIVHHDMHLSNILVDEMGQYHLIDFGLAIEYSKCFDSFDKKLNMDYLRNILIAYDPEWGHWPVEYHILGFLVFKNKPISKKDISEIVSAYYKKNVVFKDSMKNFDHFKKNAVEYYASKYAEKGSIEHNIEEILRGAYKTWDLYQLAYITLSVLKMFKVSHMDNIKDLCLKNTHYDYKKRQNVEQTKDLFLHILKDYSHAKFVFYDESNSEGKPTREVFDVNVLQSSRQLVK